jgi:hypothetical protein
MTINQTYALKFSLLIEKRIKVYSIERKAEYLNQNILSSLWCESMVTAAGFHISQLKPMHLVWILSDIW